MKKIFISLLAMLLPLSALAQFSGTGFYRVQNKNTERFLAIVDNKSQGADENTTDLGLLNTWLGFEEKIVNAPASVCYFISQSTSGNITNVNITGQGLDFYRSLNTYLQLQRNADGSYQLKGAASGAARIIQDRIRYTTQPAKDSVQIPTTGTTNANWKILPVNENAGQYFGIKSEVKATANNSYWATMYASFAFKPVSANTKVYVISRIVEDYAVLREVTGTVKGNTPVLFRMESGKPADNKLSLYTSGNASTGTNLLAGNYYCNDVTDANHRNVTNYDPTTMRMLGVDSEGKAAFVKSSISYLPANKAYLTVTATTPATLHLVTEEELTAMSISTVHADVAPQTRGVYTLGGQRIADTTEGLTKGIYIVNGKKTVVK